MPDKKKPKKNGKLHKNAAEAEALTAAPPKPAKPLLTPTRPFRLNLALPAQKPVRSYRNNLAVAAAPDVRAMADVVAGPHVRKNQADLSAEEQNRFIAGIDALIQSAFYGQLVSIHSDMSHRMHSMDGPVGTQRFLPWHRIYLFQLETELQKLHPEITIPYWDWTVDQQIPPWFAHFLPTVQVDGQTIHVTRQPGALQPTLPSPASIDFIMGRPTYTDFTTRLEGTPFGAHNMVHMWVGGTMSMIPTAPADPIFWLHHANVDRLWSLWQPDHSDQQPDLQGEDAILDPWSNTEPDTRSISTLGYSYA
ncbi:MAG TPA: tyrosinase family protein [Isosphaeraceae bacterium]|jgi:tyrosinase|nr:tyrosinase family protein [Isosphaeraceae bacterium]